MRSYAVSLCVALLLAGCGKKGPLVYPELLVPAAPSNLSAQQAGSSLKVSFTLPSKDLAGRRIMPLSGVVVFKRDVPVSKIQACTSCSDDFAVFRKINLDALDSGLQRHGDVLVLMDDSVTAGRAYTYRVSATTKDNLEGAVSPPASSAVVTPPLPPAVQAVSHPTEIQLEFVGLQPVEGAIAGFNIYRTVRGQAYSYLPLNAQVLVGNSFTDNGLERNTTYVYRIRSVVRLQSGSMLESLPSNEVEGRLKDDE